MRHLGNLLPDEPMREETQVSESCLHELATVHSAHETALHGALALVRACMRYRNLQNLTKIIVVGASKRDVKAPKTPKCDVVAILK